MGATEGLGKHPHRNSHPTTLRRNWAISAEKESWGVALFEVVLGKRGWLTSTVIYANLNTQAVTPPRATAC